MGRKKPKQVSPEEHRLANRMLRRGPTVTRVTSVMCEPEVGCRGIHCMSFIRLELALGKQMELWDSNVHGVVT